MKSEIQRREVKGEQILNILRERGSKGITTAELSKIAYRYGAYLGTLYQRGYKIKIESLGQGNNRYTLISEPKEEVLNNPKAIDVLLSKIDELGSVTSEELSTVLDELGIKVRYKPFTYNA